MPTSSDREWVGDESEGEGAPSLVFKDPVNDWDLVVMTGGDHSNHKCISTGRFNYTLKLDKERNF